jgi:outer membrane protein TolC
MKNSRKIDGIRLPLRVFCLILAALFACHCNPAAAQSPSPASGTPPVQLPLSGRQQGGVGVHQSAPAPSGSITDVQIQIPGAFAGSVPGTDTPPVIYNLTLGEAIRRGLLANLGVISSSLSVQQAAAQRAQARSTLLPNIGASASENAAKVNLAAEGFSASAFGGGLAQFPTSVGPFHYYDIHGVLQQSLLDITAIRNLSAQGHAYQAAVLDSRQAREEVVLAVTGVYLQLMTDLALVDRQQAEVKYAEAIYKQAKTETDAGNKAPIEANRSLVELQTEQQRLRSQQGEVEKRQITLDRLIGLPLGTHVQPQEQLEALATNLPEVQEVVQRAWSQREDLKAANEQLLAAQEARKAASAERLPSASVSGTYGLQGTTPSAGTSVFQASAILKIPIFTGGRIEADILQADAVVKQRTAELADHRGSVEADVRNAYIDLQVANDRVALADSNRKLATDTLRQSQDRFSVGVADSVEVVDSQQSLAAADYDFVNSLFAQHIARITLAHAVGEAEKSISALFERNAQ